MTDLGDRLATIVGPPHVRSGDEVDDYGHDEALTVEAVAPAWVTCPGTTDEVVRPRLEAGGLRAGVDFYLAFSPERIDPGNPTYGLENTPKVVGGTTPDCTKAARALYERFVGSVVEAKGTREAEMAKLLENTYRHVNIALVNEMAMFCREIDVDLWDSIRGPLEDSAWFVSVISPAAAASPWVTREIDWWVTHRGDDHLLVVLADGTCDWDPDRNDWSPTATAVPDG